MGLMDRFAEWVWRRLPAIAMSMMPLVTLALTAIGIRMALYAADHGDPAMMLAAVGIACMGASALVVGIAVAWHEWRNP